MKKLIVMMMLAVLMVGASVNLQAEDTTVSKTEWLVSKYDGLDSNRKESYALYCVIYYGADFKPERYSFIFRAQDENYEVLENRFVIYHGDAQGMYNTLNSCLKFSKEMRENGVKFTNDGVSLTNYNLKLFGWRTEISIGGAYHMFKDKDFKKMLEKFEKFCKKNNIVYTIEQ